MLKIGARLDNGRYEVTETIGKGGMSIVYMVVDNRLDGLPRALKVFYADDSQCSKEEIIVLKQAFRHEMKRLVSASKDQAHLVKATDYFEENDSQYLVMEYIPGDNLASQLEKRQRPFEVSQVLEWADHLLALLEYLHGQKDPLIHRDIKPENLMLRNYNEIVLLDFGIAEGGSYQQATPTLLRHSHSPSYAPPEQIEGKPCDAKSDLYSLAATLYALLTALKPVPASVRQKSIQQGKPDPLVLASAHNPLVPDFVTKVLVEALQLDPNKRIESAEVMRNTILAGQSYHSPHSTTFGSEQHPQIWDPTTQVDVTPTQVTNVTQNILRSYRILLVGISALLSIFVLVGLVALNALQLSAKSTPALITVTVPSASITLLDSTPPTPPSSSTYHSLALGEEIALTVHVTNPTQLEVQRLMLNHGTSHLEGITSDEWQRQLDEQVHPGRSLLPMESRVIFLRASAQHERPRRLELIVALEGELADGRKILVVELKASVQLFAQGTALAAPNWCSSCEEWGRLTSFPGPPTEANPQVGKLVPGTRLRLLDSAQARNFNGTELSYLLLETEATPPTVGWIWIEYIEFDDPELKTHLADEP